ncbi:MAG: hypothetical protein R3F46_11695 [bacterium]
MRCQSILVSFVLSLSLLSCTRDETDGERIVKTETIPLQENAPLRDEGEQVGDLTAESIQTEAGERIIGGIPTMIPPGTTHWPNGNPLPPEVLEIIRKLEAGEPISSDDETTFRAIDAKWRNWDEIEATGKSQSDS